ncbi:MAG: response regulator receiver protein [Caulobacter sp.]|nr:response regulator receiver protein [Caulobacter sp.]
MDFDTRGLKVMVVEPDRTILELIELRLAVAGYEPCMARTGRSAIEALSNFRPAALVVDLALPDMTGLELLQTLNPRQDRSAIPTLVITRQLAEGELQLCMRFGARDCLTKPFSGADVLGRVARLLKRDAPTERRMPVQHAVHI